MKKFQQQALRGGSYSIIITAVVLAVIIVVNIFVSALPSTWTSFDISSTKLYSITSNTKVVVNRLEKDVTIYWIVQRDQEDSVIENLLGKYESLSSHISVEKKNPDVYPTFAEQYTSDSVENNSLVVVCGDKYRFIAYDDIYIQTVDYTTYSYVYSFDGEGAITSAIDYVVSDELPKVYMLTGHGETDLPTSFSEQIEKENVELFDLSLLTVDTIPEDASCLMMYAPQSDISAEEATMLSDYVAAGGKLLVFAGPVDGAMLTNLYSILTPYGVTANEGILVEGDRDHYAFQYPFILMPDMYSDTITDSLIEEGYSPIIPIALGLTLDETASQVTTLLSTSSDCFSKIAGYELSTYEKEEGDVDGPFAVAIAVDDYSGGKITWFATSTFLDDTYNSYSSGANLNLGMNALSSLIGEREAIAIRSKSLSYNYLTISESEASSLKTILIGIIPLAYLGFGIIMFVKTRKKQSRTANPSYVEEIDQEVPQE